MDFVARVFKSLFRNGLSHLFVSICQRRDFGDTLLSPLRLFQNYQDYPKQEKTPARNTSRILLCESESNIIRGKIDFHVYLHSDPIRYLLRDTLPSNIHHEFMYKLLMRGNPLVEGHFISLRHLQFCHQPIPVRMASSQFPQRAEVYDAWNQ